MKDKSEFIKIMMGKYIRKALILFVGFVVTFALFDSIFRELKPLIAYLIKGAISTLFCILFIYFDDKGWNSWKKIGSLFKRKNADD